VSDSVLVKIVVSIVILLGFAVWLISDQAKRSPLSDRAPTDISASRK